MAKAVSTSFGIFHIGATVLVPQPRPILLLFRSILHPTPQYHPKSVDMSNILSVFNPPPARDIPDEPCLPCTAIQSLMSFAGGLYLNLNSLFKDLKGKINIHKNPIWWQNSVKSLGILLIGLGAYRAGEAGLMVWNRKRN